MKEYLYNINGKEYKVTIHSVDGNIADVTVNGKRYTVENKTSECGQETASVQNIPQKNKQTEEIPAGQVAEKAGGTASQITSPLPGIIVEICVKEGQSVKSGDKIAVLEAMKMENEIQADKSGVISSIHVNKGDSVQEGAVIASIS